jgi:hypothetical protein
MVVTIRLTKGSCFKLTSLKLTATTCALFVLILMATLAGCGTPSSTSDGSAKPDSAKASQKTGRDLTACALLAKEDAESLLGETVGAPTTTRNDAMGNIVTQCRYSTATGSKRVGLLARQASSGEEAAQIFKKAQSESASLSGSEPQVISGLGDAAYWTGGSLKQLNVLKGEAWLIITAALGNGTDPLEASKAVALKILARLA